MTASSNEHYSQHSKSIEEERNQRHLEKKVWRKNCRQEASGTAGVDDDGDESTGQRAGERERGTSALCCTKYERRGISHEASGTAGDDDDGDESTGQRAGERERQVLCAALSTSVEE